MKISILLLLFSFNFFVLLKSQHKNYFQQKVRYGIHVTLDDINQTLEGTQKIVYHNNSPYDTLNRIYFHLYWNAFQPNSMMDLQSRNIADPDPRLGDKISKFNPSENGGQFIQSLKVNGQIANYKIYETIMELQLIAPLNPFDSIIIDISFLTKIPPIVRRAGRNSKQNIQYSFSQWYPKICEFDRDGWHLNPYIMREFYGVWGDYKVWITAPSDYIVPAGGYLLNEEGTPLSLTFEKHKNRNVVWKYEAKNVHDFVWAADKKYQVEKRKVSKDLTFKFFFNDSEDIHQWEETMDKLVKSYDFVKNTYGEYPFKEYSFIQGGDGGMEYPMATLISTSNFSTAIHEFMHSWYQMLLATNESLFAWMDEGFTSYASDRVINFIENGDSSQTNRDYYQSYYNLIKFGMEEPLTTHADHFKTNHAYSIASYVKGAIFLDQLGYIVGDYLRDSILKKYYYTFRFTHPDVNSFFSIAEKISGMSLKWYKEHWINTTKTIDYSITLKQNNSENIHQTAFLIKRESDIPMPLDILVKLKKDSSIFVHIPLYYSFERKTENPYGKSKQIVLDPEAWINSEYTFHLPYDINDIAYIEIDPTKRMADINRNNNSWSNN